MPKWIKLTVAIEATVVHDFLPSREPLFSLKVPLPDEPSPTQIRDAIDDAVHRLAVLREDVSA